MSEPWHITQAACSYYARLREWSEKSTAIATRELLALRARAHFVERDLHGRELWRSPRSDGGLRWVVDPRGTRTDKRARVIWVGRSRPPARLWTRASPESANR